VVLPREAETFDDIIAELMADEDFAALFDCLPPAPKNHFAFPTAAVNGDGRDSPAITEKQMRLFSRRHLMAMLCEIEEERQRVTEERDHLLLAYQAGLSQGRLMP
jgi:hypothetical protein